MGGEMKVFSDSFPAPHPPSVDIRYEEAIMVLMIPVPQGERKSMAATVPYL